MNWKKILECDLDKIILLKLIIHFLNELYTSTDSYGVLDEIINALLNTSSYTYEVSSVLLY